MTQPSLFHLNHPKLEKMILNQMDRWNDCSAFENSTLLRLSLLKDLLEEFRKEKSHYLATGLKNEISEIKMIEKKIESLRESILVENDLKQILKSPPPQPRKKKLIPENLFLVLKREELYRFDRIWESALIAEGLSEGWSLWCLETPMLISSLTEWTIYFSKQLWPHGVIIFLEDHSQANVQHLKEIEQTYDNSYFLSRCFFLLNPQFQHPLQISPHLLKWKGILELSSYTTSWKKIYPDSVTALGTL